MALGKVSLKSGMTNGRARWTTREDAKTSSDRLRRKADMAAVREGEADRADTIAASQREDALLDKEYAKYALEYTGSPYDSDETFEDDDICRCCCCTGECQEYDDLVFEEVLIDGE